MLLKKLKSKITTRKDEADIIFTTTHKSKGLEYDQVLMANDFVSKKEITNQKNKMSLTQEVEELNIYYVISSLKVPINHHQQKKYAHQLRYEYQKRGCQEH